MKAILIPVALAALSADARADHCGGFFARFGRFMFGFGRPPVCAPVLPFPPVVRCVDTGHYEWRERRVFVPGTCEDVWVDPVYECRTFGCRTVRFCVRPGYFRKVFHDGTYRVERHRVWVPGPVVCG